MSDATIELMNEGLDTAFQLIQTRNEIRRLRGERDSLFSALRDIVDWWGYAIAKSDDAELSADDEATVDRLAVQAIDALHKADQSYVGSIKPLSSTRIVEARELTKDVTPD